mgnify:CR=1 FL=1|tara:strand:+ start:1415 stop:1969 length:555 start_codon:yes stop_codon:yes gene_type:complete
MSLWDTVTGWIDTSVDWVAEALDYTDEDFIDITGEVYKGATAGEQLTMGVKDFIDSDTFGFIKKGADAYAKASGLVGKDGKRTNQPLIQQTKFVKRRGADFRTSRAMTQTSPITGNPVNIGYNNPDVRSALTALAQSSYNQQMNNMFSQYLVRPTKGIGSKTIGLGTTQVKGISKKSRQTTTRN